MLRIHFTVADAMSARVVVLGAHAETQHSFTKLSAPRGQLVFDAWRARTAMRTRVLPPDVREVARFVTPPADLITLVGPADEYAQAAERLHAAPAGPLGHELTCTPAAAAGPRSAWIGDLAAGDGAARRRLTRALGDYHEAAIAPYWPRLRTLLENDRAARVDTLARLGLGALLSGLGPLLSWSAPVLSLHDPALDRDYHLAGRGLTLAPTVFGDDHPGVFVPWDDSPALLMYPVALDPPTAMRLWHHPADPGDRALASLLGATRAAALRVVAGGCTTSELAKRLNISPGGASQHATVLRESGLISSHRYRNTVRHTITRLGRDLLNTS
jgi:DNA-binding transcriptional ArsR family regulator